MYTHTIAAIATAPGGASVAIVRLSGPEALSIASALFDGDLAPRRINFGRIVDPETKAPVDEVIALWMPAPHSFTAEDVVEFQCHGGGVAAPTILRLVLAAGAQMARPGEFTLRAYLNGRVDLAQAESVLDIVNARTAEGLEAALGTLDGRLSRPVKTIRRKLLDTVAYLTATIDFPEDDVPVRDVTPQLEEARGEIDDLLANADAGIRLRSGARVTLVGKPNVGKSSLMNRLLRSNRAIVTDVPGTTRDTVEETASIAGIPVVLTDTAGIGDGGDIAERIGVERSRASATASDLLLVVLDRSREIDGDDEQVLRLARERPTLIVLNKCDLPAASNPSTTFTDLLEVSAETGAGLDGLEGAIARELAGVPSEAIASSFVANARQKAALAQARDNLDRALESHRSGMAADFVTIDANAALNDLGEITGETAGEELLDAIFSQFCIGK